MAQTVVGLFNSASEAQQAVQQLMSAGFVQSNVDVAAQDARNAQTVIGGGSSTSGRNNDPSDYTNSSGTSVEGAADATARTAGRAEDGISNFFSNLFGGDDNDDARAYTSATRSGRSVVTVHAASADEAERARDLLDNAGAIDVHEGYTRGAYGMTGSAQGYAASGTQATGTAEGAQKLNIIEENLQVGKRVEQTGGARIRSRIIEKPVEEHVRLREEHVNIQRRDVNRPATAADFEAFKEGEISVTESAERAVVAKEARVVGEVSIGKEVTEREETVRDTVRSTDVQVEQLGTNQTGTRSAEDDAYNSGTGTTNR
ncbi:YsnF/AvaK domain-containing protein [Hymenobacter monticola]|uniref:YsnF/AvaK domain-containing protein n=1 Tax=Hymenobacter monticola TaxID=1705399 RepID=A0ABY4B3E7_9BACT|nr:YsnF/AvaK domain-containing protein [Hymenobacter monticola]UOE33510.1 YsnF/AvaK domain-containing protein [Hymenobacter monticola]